MLTLLLLGALLALVALGITMYVSTNPSVDPVKQRVKTMFGGGVDPSAGCCPKCGDDMACGSPTCPMPENAE